MLQAKLDSERKAAEEAALLEALERAKREQAEAKRAQEEQRKRQLEVCTLSVEISITRSNL